MLNKSEIIKKIRENKWYRQGANSKVFFLQIPARGVWHRAKPELAFTPIVNKVKWEAYFIEGEYDRKAKFYIKKEKESPGYFEKELGEIKKRMKKLEDFYKELDFDISKAGLKTILEYAKKLDKLNFEMWEYTYVPDFFDPNGEAFLQREIKGIEFEENELSTLLKPGKKSWVQVERKEFLLSDDMEKHAQKYFWIDNSWESAKILTKYDFEKRKKELSEEEIKEQHFELERDIAKEQEEIIEKHNLPEDVKNVLNLYRQLFYLRDERKKYVMLNNHFYRLFFLRISEIFDIPYENLSVIYADDLNESTSKEEIIQMIKERENNLLFVFEGLDFRSVAGLEAKEIIELLHKTMEYDKKEIKGQTGCRGKAKGTARIVMGETHFGKFNEGDILVAPNTRPEYVPLMKKAGAIITDEGGMTSHAAVISRELKVPCVIGTKLATKVLKDNDNVEVDADKGIVRIIK